MQRDLPTRIHGKTPGVRLLSAISLLADSGDTRHQRRKPLPISFSRLDLARAVLLHAIDIQIRLEGTLSTTMTTTERERRS